MLVEVFDDRKGSIAHLTAGALTYYALIFFIIFIAYEIIEYIYLKGKEREANFLGDLFEYSFGIMLMTVLDKTICFGALVFAAFLIALWLLMGRWDQS